MSTNPHDKEAETMELVQLDPFSVLRDVERMFEPRGRAQAWMPRVDIFDRDTALVVRAEVPGIDPDSIEVTVEDRTLTISGTRSTDQSIDEAGYHRREIFTGEFKRTIVLPEGLDAEAITATATAGMLEVSIPRRPEVLPRKVKIDVAS